MTQPARCQRVNVALLAAAVVFTAGGLACADEITSENNPRLKAALERFPEADANRDGILTLEEAETYRNARQAQRGDRPVQLANRKLSELAAMEKKGNGLWVASTGHSLVAPAMGPFVAFAQQAGYDGHVQCKQLSGGVSGAPRAQWARTGERQIMKPALALGKWDVMTMGTHMEGSDVEDFGRWIELGLKHNPKMVFYIQDVWPRLTDVIQGGQLTGGAKPKLEPYEKRMDWINDFVAERVEALNEKFGDKVFVIPVGNGMRELVSMQLDGKLPGVDEIFVSKNDERGRVGLYRDSIHPSRIVAQLEGYIYFACLYKENPAEVPGKGVENPELGKILRQVAWKVATEHPHSGVK